MPIIFHKVATGWKNLPIPAPGGLLRFGPVGYEPEHAARPAPPDSFVLVRIGTGREWAAVVRHGTRVLHNGQPVAAGLRILAHRDSLAVPSAGPVFFSTEEPVRVEPFAGPEQVTCPRCKLEIAPGMLAVRCPGCGVLQHEEEDRPCWTYAQACAVCPHPTALDAGLQWTPEMV